MLFRSFRYSPATPTLSSCSAASSPPSSQDFLPTPVNEMFPDILGMPASLAEMKMQMVPDEFNTGLLMGMGMGVGMGMGMDMDMDFKERMDIKESGIKGVRRGCEGEVQAEILSRNINWRSSTPPMTPGECQYQPSLSFAWPGPCAGSYPLPQLFRSEERRVGKECPV